MSWVFFIIMPLLFGSVIYFVIKNERHVKENWEAAAKKLHLIYTPGIMFTPGSINGRYKHHYITVSTYTEGGGKSSTTYTKYTITYNKKIPVKFKLTKEEMFHSLGKMFGFQDIQVGDETFDDNVIVKGDNPSNIIRFLNAPRRKRIKEAFLMFPRVTITNKLITIVIRGRAREKAAIICKVHYIFSLSNAIVKNYDDKHPIKRSESARKKGNIKEAIKIIQSTQFDDEDDALNAKEQEGEVLYIAGKTDEATKAFQELSEKMDNDESCKQWQQLSIPEPIEETPQELSSVERNKDESLSIETISKEFFESNLTTYAITQQFEERLRNREIKWEGIIDRVQKFSFDLIFSDCKGVRVSIVIDKLESTMGNQPLRAIVQFPEDKIDMLKKLKGKQISFSGKMVKLDAFMHNIYIADGEINKEINS